MIDLTAYSGLRVAVMGLGRSGLATAKALMATGAEVWAWDDDPPRRQAAAAENIPLVDLGTCAWATSKTLVWSPGISHTLPTPHPVAVAARRAGAEVICDIELLAQAQPAATFVAITGTNGKSTTTALAAHILIASGVRAAAGGNLGPPALSLSPLGEGEIYVLELSSYQLELLATASFDMACLINISPDHLDRHGGMASYVTAKRRIFAGAGRQSEAIIATDDDHTRAIAEALGQAGGRHLTRVAVGGGPADVTVTGGILHDRGKPAMDLNGVATLPGRHNWQNAAMAYAIARRLGLSSETIAKYLATYPGLPHRQELVANIDGVRFVNDSKATNAEATARALDCYENIYWIAGGIAKAGGLGGLEPWYARIVEAYLVGAAAEPFAQALDGHVPHRNAGNLATAVAMAHARSRRDGRDGAVVLLSPACASFDQWPGFEARGNAFRQMVLALRRAPIAIEMTS